MKTLGHLENGNILIECTSQEQRALSLLVKVATGQTYSRYAPSRDEDRIDAEMADTLSAVAEWIEIKDRANVLRNIAEGIDMAIRSKAKP